MSIYYLDDSLMLFLIAEYCKNLLINFKLFIKIYDNNKIKPLYNNLEYYSIKNSLLI